jgi:RHH-type proline utilization regulon transcriptional repressor/proline dehydrogenase/delta 1-pyrroline-5-carboxylate dehydrogenase
LRDWALRARPELAALCDRLASLNPVGASVGLPGPTGERNTYNLFARESVLCLAESEGDLLSQLALVLAVGGKALCSTNGPAAALLDELPMAVRSSLALVDDWAGGGARFDAALHHGAREARIGIQRKLAAIPGPIVSLHGFEPGEAPLAIERLLVERVVSVNTAAAGGNASLMTVG